MPNDLLTDAFFEVRTIRGYRYLDDAGKIMNHWDSQFPEKAIGPEGLVMSNRDALIRQLRVNTGVIWLNLNIPDSVDQVVGISLDTVSRISEIIGVQQYHRVGLRLNYICPIGNVQKVGSQIVENLFSKEWFPDGEQSSLGFKGFEFMVPLEVAQGIQANVRVSVVRRDPKSKPRKTLPSQGVLIDVDIFRIQSTEIHDLKGILNKAQNWMEVEFPRARDSILKGVDLGDDI